MRSISLSLAGAVLLVASPAPLAAQEGAPALELSMAYTADVTGVVGGVRPRAGRYLDNLDLAADVDLERTAGWRGAMLHAHVLSNAGGAPNDVAGTLQGVDNIEVTKTGLRLYELWVEQALADGRASVRAGLYDLNSEFYVNDSAALLIGPAFGIGSELAATGPNGPSIFPSTALGVRVAADLGGGRYLRAAALNAKSGVLGDPGGVDWSFDDGALTIAEAGVGGSTRLGVGAWRYTKRQDDIREASASGEPARRRAQGAYVLAEQRLLGAPGGRQASAFLRVGVSDGATTPFEGGWQAGVLINGPFASRPHGAFSVGVQQGLLNRRFRANLRDDGLEPARAETGVEITYADRLSRRITVQPDLQWIRHAGGDRRAKDRLVAAFRVKVDLGPGAAE